MCVCVYVTSMHAYNMEDCFLVYLCVSGCRILGNAPFLMLFYFQPSLSPYFFSYWTIICAFQEAII